jgi:non-specific serine/threonine protein kinase
LNDMRSERWRQIEELYHSALAMELTRRDRFLAEACQGDIELRKEVESLLAQSSSSGVLVDSSAWAAVTDAATVQTILKSGETLGPYRILQLLGRGGMGEVHLALDTRLDRKVAVKVCLERFSGRFGAEARAISALNHPNICTLYDVGPNYLVTEFVEGETLLELLKQPFPVERSLDTAKQVLAALGAAHRAGIVHRDLKPANIMVRRDGYVKVLDFGLAKRTLATAVMNSVTTLDVSLPGGIVGTVAYMSPEQIAGQDVDQRSDLFAFGIILYEMLIGRHPWKRNSDLDTLHSILHDEPRLELLHSNLAPLLQRLLSKNASERYPSADAVLEALAKRSAGAATEVSGPQRLKSIAVLPFAFLNEVEDRSALSLGFADALITMLASLDDVIVAPTSAILKYSAGAEPAEVCRNLGVRHTLQGYVQKLGPHWRVSIQLFDMTTQRMTFSERLDFQMENVFEVQDEIGRRIVNALETRFHRVASKSRERYSSDPEAYGEFMAGLRESYCDSQQELQSAAEHLVRAIELDPDFALAHAWLSHVSMQIYFAFDAQRTWLERAEQHYQRALRLDPDLPEAHWARAAILWSPAKNFEHAEAIASLERVLEARPNFDRAHNRMSAICIHIGRFNEAQIADDLAQRANPRSRSYNYEYLCLYSGDFARAKEVGEAWFRGSQGNKNALWYSAHSLLLAGDLDAAADRLLLGLGKYPHEPLLITLQGMLYARRGQPDAALDSIRRALDFPISFGHAHHTYHHIACIHAVLGQTDKAMAWLQKSVDTGNPCWPFFRADPFLENLRPQPLFQQMVTALQREFLSLKIARL